MWITWCKFRTILFYSFDLGNNNIFKKIFFFFWQFTRTRKYGWLHCFQFTYLHINTVLIFSKYLLLNIFDSTINLPKYRLIRFIYIYKKKIWLTWNRKVIGTYTTYLPKYRLILIKCFIYLSRNRNCHSSEQPDVFSEWLWKM